MHVRMVTSCSYEHVCWYYIILYYIICMYIVCMYTYMIVCLQNMHMFCSCWLYTFSLCCTICSLRVETARGAQRKAKRKAGSKRRTALFRRCLPSWRNTRAGLYEVHLYGSIRQRPTPWVVWWWHVLIGTLCKGLYIPPTPCGVSVVANTSELPQVTRNSC